jgi:hypothetical protein
MFANSVDEISEASACLSTEPDLGILFVLLVRSLNLDL